MNLERRCLGFLLLLPASIPAQTNHVDKAEVAAMRGKYYSLPLKGFESMECPVTFDMSTVPMLPTATDDPLRKIVAETRFSVRLTSRGDVAVDHQPPANADAAVVKQAEAVVNIMTSLIQGVFMTWMSKGLSGPIPPFDTQVESVKKLQDGYALSLDVPGKPVEVSLDPQYVATRITSLDGKVDEHPSYSMSPDGLILTGNEAVDSTQAGAPVHVRYEIGSAVVDGLRVPNTVHLVVAPNLDVRYELAGCSVKKGTVLEVSPPATPSKP